MKTSEIPCGVLGMGFFTSLLVGTGMLPDVSDALLSNCSLKLPTLTPEKYYKMIGCGIGKYPVGATRSYLESQLSWV